MSREILLQDIKLKKLLEQRNKIVLEGRKEDDARQKLEDSIKKKGLELQKIDGKATEIIKKKKIELVKDLENKVFEEIIGAGLNKGKIVITIQDKFQEYAEAIKRSEEEKNKPQEEKKDK